MRIQENDDFEEQFPNQAALFQANIDRALRGKKGQALLRELEAALLALPNKRLIEGHFAKAGQVCALGSVAVCRVMKQEGISFADAVAKIESIWLEDVDPEFADEEDLTDQATDFATGYLKMKQAFAFEVMWRNDLWGASPEDRYAHVLAWVQKRLALAKPPIGESS